jgi:RND family efflux transporter MFP subunit
MPNVEDTPMNERKDVVATQTHSNGAETKAVAAADEKTQPKSFPRGAILALAVAAVVVVVAVVFGILARAAAETRLARETDLAATPTVNVVYPQPAKHADDIVLPGNTQAFIDSPIYARTNGYLKKWYVDIGARVKQGQLLAEIETPELDQQLRQARAEVVTAQANYNLSQITAARNENLLKTHSVSTQERDNAVNLNAANKSTVESNEANVARLEQLQAFEKVYAPFDGIITARSTDIGALIDAGANAPKELFHIASIHTLRVYIAVPEVYSSAAHSGAQADLTLDEFPKQVFHGTVVRNSNAIDASSRTLLVEVDVNNDKGVLMPGAYVQVRLKTPGDGGSLTVPSNSLIFRREGLQVAVVRDGKAQLVSVTPGHDYGDSMEILAGLNADDQVILSPADSLANGTPVQVASAANGGGK